MNELLAGFHTETYTPDTAVFLNSESLEEMLRTTTFNISCLIGHSHSVTLPTSSVV